jgi:hypothetical protein
MIGIDIGKNSFHLVGLDKRGAIVLRQKWSRGQVEARLANMQPCLIGMEACVGARAPGAVGWPAHRHHQSDPRLPAGARAGVAGHSIRDRRQPRPMPIPRWPPPSSTHRDSKSNSVIKYPRSAWRMRRSISMTYFIPHIDGSVRLVSITGSESPGGILEVSGPSGTVTSAPPSTLTMLMEEPTGCRMSSSGSLNFGQELR